MKYVSYMGEVYRLSNRNYRIYLQSVAGSSGRYPPNPPGLPLGNITDVTDLAPESAAVMLEQLKGK